MKGMFVLLMLMPLIVDAEVYRWQDENGNWQFGDQPPNSGHEKIEIKSPAKIGQDERVKEIHERTLRLRQSEKAKEEEKAAARRKHQEAMKKPCDQAKERLKRLKRPFVYVDEAGNRTSASADQVKADIEKTEKWIEQNCTF